MDPVTWVQVGMAAYSVISGLFGSKNKTPKAPQYVKDMYQRSQQLVADSEALQPQMANRRADLMSLKDERDRNVARGIATAQAEIGAAPAANTETGGQFVSAVTGQNQKRAMALSRVAQAGDAAAEQQGLRDRIAVTGRGLNSAKIALGMGDKLTSIDSASRAANFDRRQEREELYGDAIGTALGAFDSWYQKRKTG